MKTVFLKNNHRVTGDKIIVLGEDVPGIIGDACTTGRDVEIVIRALIDSGSLAGVLDAVVSCAMREKSPALELLKQAFETELMK